MFCKWSCGCIGLDPSTHPQQAPAVFHGEGIVILPCDRDADVPRHSLVWSRRNMDGKTLVAMPFEDAQALHRLIGSRLYKADRFDTLRHALGVPEEDV